MSEVLWSKVTVINLNPRSSSHMITCDLVKDAHKHEHTLEGNVRNKAASVAEGVTEGFSVTMQ